LAELQFNLGPASGIEQQAESSQWVALWDCRMTKNFYSYEQEYEKKM